MPRDPYPYPKYETDNEFVGSRDTEVIKHAKKMTKTGNANNISAQDPWTRLYGTQTLTSSRRTVFSHDPQAPRDNLDFVVKSKYNHHQEFLKSKAQTLFQPETLGFEHGRTLKNRPGPQAPDIDLANLPLRKSADVKKGNINSVNGAIGPDENFDDHDYNVERWNLEPASHHSAATNGGYSRKHDGGFYTC
eukprot:gene6007-6705_t